jgi:23S rRNA pseudouridine2605 synthase
VAPERLQKILARCGVASRRAAEELITAGRVRVNGRIAADLGTRASLGRDRIEVDGKRLVAGKPVYGILHKPRGVVTTLSDPEGRTTFRELMRDLPERVFPIGRLDYHTSGALLFTNDGELAEALLKPAMGVPKVYVAKVQGKLGERELGKLCRGVQLEDGARTRPAAIFVLREEGQHTWIQVTLTEGKNRQIHRMAEVIGRRVMRLARLSFAGISTEDLRPGEYRLLKDKEVEDLKKRYLKSRRRPAPAT